MGCFYNSCWNSNNGYYSDSRRGEGMGWYGMAMTIAMAIGPMIGLWVVQNYSFDGLFLLATLLSFMAVVLSLITKIHLRHKRKRENSAI